MGFLRCHVRDALLYEIKKQNYERVPVRLRIKEVRF